MKAYLLTISLTIYTLASQAQYGFTEARLITKQNDTISCEVLRAITYDKNVTYRVGPSGPNLTIPVKNVRSIETDKMYWENIPLGKKEKMMNLVTDGKIKLFNHVTINSGTPGPGPGGSGTYTPYTAPTILYVWEKDGIFYEVKKKNLVEMTEKLMSDCNAVVEKVKRKDYTFDSMGALVTDYNQCY